MTHVGSAYVNAILFEVTDPTVQCLFFRLRKSLLRAKIDHKTS